MEIKKLKLLGEGAEAKVWLGEFQNKKVVIKERLPKRYRHPKIDYRFRKYRTRREAKIMQKLEKLNIPGPKLLGYDEEKSIIIMEYIDGIRLAQCLEKLEWKKVLTDIGRYVAKMHDNNIIHADLTTSNILVNNLGLYFIDFGLSFISAREEDKAVDIHLFREALESKHWKIYPEAFKYFIKGYKESKNFERIYKRFLKVERRGRYKI